MRTNSLLMVYKSYRQKIHFFVFVKLLFPLFVPQVNAGEAALFTFTSIDSSIWTLRQEYTGYVMIAHKINGTVLALKEGMPFA